MNSEKKKNTVLIVDDTLFMRRMLREIFESNDIEVIAEAGTGKEAVELYEKHLPDFVTMDIAMPEMDGLQALKAIRDIDPVAVVIMVSSMGFQEKVIEAIRLGAKNFIVKPLTESKVMDVVSKILSSG